MRTIPVLSRIERFSLIGVGMGVASDDLPIASRSRRRMARLLDALPFVALVIARSRASGAKLRSWMLFITGLEGIYTVGLTATRGQTVGQMIMGVRVVDRTTGSRPAWPQCTLRWVVDARGQLVAALFPTPRWIEAFRQLQPEVERLRREHGDDRGRLNQELMALYRQHHVTPWAGLLPLVMFEVVDTIALRKLRQDPLGQGPHDRVANTVVVLTDARRTS